jgi:tRNA A-37 threonylcarbamoyl transferase component Bud32
MTAMNGGGPGGRVVDGRFELLERLGGGGMGLVWRARDTALDREVALKEVRPPDLAESAADPEGARLMRERVLREARALARLQHPNVVTIHHIVDTPEHPYPWLVMELVTGGSLADRLARGPLSVPEAAWVGRGVLSALRAAHAAGIQHRDVKPGNVLLRTAGHIRNGSPVVGTPVLTDFGIAAVRDATALTATGALIGSPEYIAPERIRGREGDPSSDLWSLGMLLYVAVEGRHPLRRSTALATLAAVLDEPLPAPERSGALGPLLTALLVKDPAARPDADRIDLLLAAAEQSAPAGGPAAPSLPAPPYSGGASSTGTAHPAPPFPAAGGTPPAGTPHPAAGGTPGTGAPYPPPPYHGAGQAGQAAQGQGYAAPGRTPPGHIPSAYGPPSYGTPPPGAPVDRRPAPAGASAVRRRIGRVALAVLSSTSTIGLVTFGVWQLVPHDGPEGSHRWARPRRPPEVAPAVPVPTPAGPPAHHPQRCSARPGCAPSSPR